MSSSLNPLNLLKIAQALFILNAVIWLALGIASLAKPPDGYPGGPTTVAIIAVLMFGNAAAMLGNEIGIGTKQRRFYALALAVLGINIILTVTDEFGALDLITLGIDVILLGLLIADRKRYIHPSSGSIT